MKYLLGLFPLIQPSSSFARWSTAELVEEAGGSFLFWIPIGIAGFLYKKLDESGNGGSAAVLGGAISLLLILNFPIQMALAALAGLGIWLLVSYFKQD